MPQKKDFTEEFVFENSQGSDDPSFEQALLKHYATVQERKHRAKQQKFLQAAENKLSEEVNSTAEAVRNCIQQLESSYATFIFEYASTDDRIRAMWDQIRSLDEKYIAVLEDIGRNQITHDDQTEEKQMSGLSKIRAACEDYGRVVDQMSE
ncbi:hypothetical protein P691DRAFT_761543 [Macrolepiota fuliginosa MF-IS2]|uniref:Uncharacterized protein n=1 Tax=Macrolepiota fuliginosa MF-IS2 TaxID=1400762 RepID=A0A9P5X9E8_9AGAR|nr:hypothetical protein P691DRAFT_761543 [Macrolepiota fuliginosa MF-IS2]